ncbi:MAG TPA: invasion associated locus B family protein [Thiolinea sp.]|nr:invasion associated locus B family protein [Thiolinea sp.]
MVPANTRFLRNIPLLLVWGVMLSSQPALASLQGQRFQDWGGNCETGDQNRTVCYLEQVLSHNDRPLMITVIGYAPGNAMPTIFFELPKTIDIRNGIQLQVDNQAPIRFQGHCDETRCTAGFALDRNILAQFRKGRKATVSYQGATNGQQVQLPLSLMGISAGLNALQHSAS